MKNTCAGENLASLKKQGCEVDYVKIPDRLADFCVPFSRKISKY